MLALLYIILCLVTKDSDAAIIGEYKYSGYGISFYSTKLSCIRTKRLKPEM